MKNTFGNVLTVTIFGESHGPEIGVVLDGLASGISVSEERIRQLLSLRRPAGAISTSRVEADEFRIMSGVFEGKTTGTPLAMRIPNSNTRSKDYGESRFIARPGHADYTAHVKYHGFEDYRGGGHQSGRITAALTACGGILIPALERKGILIGTHIRALGGGGKDDSGFLYDRPFAGEEADLVNDIRTLSDRLFAVLDPEAEEGMKARILEAAKDGDSVGGILETAVTGVPAGLGEPWFDSMESELSHILFSVPAVKGVEFGEAFSSVRFRGSAYNDAFYADKPEKKETAEGGREAVIRTKTNHNGGINGGITNGMPILFRTAIKPTPSVYREQDTVNFRTMENVKLKIEGRHDPAILHRARVVIDCCAAIVLSDMLSLRFGTHYLAD